MPPFYLRRAFAPAGAPVPAPAPPISQGMRGLLMDAVGHIVSLLITLATIVWEVVQVAATSTTDDMLSIPLLGVHDHDVAARRYQNCLVAAVLHSLTTILYTYKDQLLVTASKSMWMLFLRCPGASIILIVSFVLLIMLVWYYSITEVTRMVVGSIFISYLLIVITDNLCLENTIILEIMLVPLTICMHTLRFVSQGASTQIEVIPLLVAVLGVLTGISCIITLITEFEDKDGIHHLAFKIYTLLGSVFRLLDIIFMSGGPIRDMANYFRSKLQECFI